MKKNDKKTLTLKLKKPNANKKVFKALDNGKKAKATRSRSRSPTRRATSSPSSRRSS